MGMISRLWSNGMIRPILETMERFRVRLRETLVYSIDVRSAGHAKSKIAEGLEFSIAPKPLVDWPAVIAASSQAPGPGEPQDIWINAIRDGTVVGTLAICFRPYFVEEASMWVHFPGGYVFGYNVLEGQRGKGVGRSLLLRAIDLMMTPERGERLFALVDSRNVASKKTFEATGFKVEKSISSLIVAGKGLHKVTIVAS